MFYSFLSSILKVIFALLTNLRVEGRENLPSNGPYLFAINHLSYIDSALVYALIGGEQLASWVADKYRHNLIIGTLVRLSRPIFIRRGKVDRKALDAAFTALSEGKIFGLAPEGTRSKTGGLQRAKSGAAYLASRSGAPVVPVALIGTEKTFHDLRHLRRPHITVRIGTPFPVPSLNEASLENLRQRASFLRKQTDEIMCQIAALLPPKYRGFYAEYPRLQELLDKGK
jgi:1-acyl-sn-glycerol-3-phosphate acyltransferase